MTLAAQALAGPSFSCVHFTAARPAPEDLAALGILAAAIDGDPLEDDRTLLAAVAEAFEFPDYFGANWDALDECLRDMSWAPAAGYVLVVTGAEGLWQRDPRLAARLVRSWLFCAEDWAGREVGLHLVFEW